MIISSYMKSEHRECDESFSAAEKAMIEGDFEKAEELFIRFSNETLTHFKREEESLFPTFEELSGSAEGPTKVMRYEHEQMRNLIGKLAGAVESKDTDEYLSIAESMMILLQQHNMKEEQMLYAMCDRMMPSEVKEETLSIMKAIQL